MRPVRRHLRWPGTRREDFRCQSHQPVTDQSQPFVGGKVGGRETRSNRHDGPVKVGFAAGAVVDRIGNNVCTGRPEACHRPRHVRRGCHQQPLLSGLRLEGRGAFSPVFAGVSGYVFDRDAGFRHADANENVFGDLGFRWCVVVHEMVCATRKKDSGVGIEPAEFGGCGQPFRSFVERRAFPVARDMGVDRSPNITMPATRPEIVGRGKRSSRTINTVGPIGDPAEDGKQDD
jgi:hypothetical protein